MKMGKMKIVTRRLQEPFQGLTDNGNDDTNWWLRRYDDGMLG